MVWRGKTGIACLGALYGLSALTLYCAIPGPLREFDYMVIGTGSTAITLAAFFLGLVLRRRA